MFGSHLSIAGGMHLALLAAEGLNLQSVQVFTKNQQQWVAKPLEAETITRFREESRRLGFDQIVAHDSYLINLAAVDPVLRAKSLAAFADEMHRCDQLGISYLVTHPGAHVGQGEQVGIKNIIAAFDEIVAKQGGGNGGGVTICIESTAGQGTTLGHRFEHLAEILAGVRHPERFGVCVDTCHTLAAGYDLTTAESTQRVLEEFDRVIGLKHLKVWHLNDSKKPLGSRVDRHEHIGRGCIGLDAFAVICQDIRFAKVPKILETAKEKAPDGRDWDEVNLEVLRKLSAGQKVRIEPFVAEATGALFADSAPTKPAMTKAKAAKGAAKTKTTKTVKTTKPVKKAVKKKST